MFKVLGWTLYIMLFLIVAYVYNPIVWYIFIGAIILKIVLGVIHFVVSGKKKK